MGMVGYRGTRDLRGIPGITAEGLGSNGRFEGPLWNSFTAISARLQERIIFII